MGKLTVIPANSWPKLLKPGNTKLGPRIKNFALPAVKTCFPSKSCEIECFGLQFRYRMSYIQDLYQKNWDFTRLDDFAEVINRQLRSERIGVTRWHTVGDYYRAEPPNNPDAYVRTVLGIVQANPQVHFYSYTRSWTQEDLAPALRELSEQDNFTMWLSCDASMPQPPLWSQVKFAYMAISDDDAPEYPVDLVFRAGSRAKPMKRDIRGNLVCPYEQGITRQVAITCTSCGICFDQKPVVPIANLSPKRAK